MRLCIAVGLTMFLLDWLLCFRAEVDAVWFRKLWNTSCYSYIVIRYGSIVGLIYGAYGADICLTILLHKLILRASHKWNQPR